MKIDTDSSAIEDFSDASLVIASLGGDRQAFGQIVARYQRLLCSMAYSSLGSLSESEDVAQEAFVEAWKKLGNLREPEKLKSWLCGILRFKISRHRRKESRQPVRQASELHEADILDSPDKAIEDAAMNEEEQALLWKALETVPETYRETLILYYREHRSVEHVASELDLSEDAVKQRLSRGRKVLKEKMMNFVEGALTRSAPSHVFTATVIAAITTLAPSAKAAGFGATAAKVG
ncbi:MAG: sigma-70 family RNA polymerase sigma factor, partial [Opitutales bacterium]|nr:sigma-70 family RNA polymerase sigma factor [Opitutales bacterium]